MKGRTRTAAERKFHDLLASLGCVCCRIDGLGHNPMIEIHHLHGRTKEYAHWYCIPLCLPHHRDQGVPGVIAVHPWKARFEEKYGKQMDLLRQSIQHLVDQGHQLPAEALAIL